MAWLNEEERALRQGRFAPVSQFDMGVRQPDAVARSFPKVQPQTGQFDTLVETGQRFIDAYEKGQLSQAQAAAQQQDNALTNDYAARISDLRMQLSSGAISPQAFGMRERELYIQYVRAGVDASKLNTLRTGLGGNIIQKSQDTYATEEAKADVRHESEMVKAFQQANPAFQNVDRSTALAYIKMGEGMQEAVRETASIINDPNTTSEVKALYEKEQEGNIYRQVAFKSINAVKNVMARYEQEGKKAVVMTPAIADEMENAAVADLVNVGVEERAARYFVKQAQQSYRSFANANYGLITDFNKLNDAVIKTLEQNDTQLAYSVTPISMFISKFGQAVQGLSGVLPKTQMEAELKRMADMKVASADAFAAVSSGKVPEAYKNSTDAQGAVNMMTDAVYNGLTVVAPDLGAAVVSIGARNFNEINYGLSKGGVSSLTADELDIARENAAKLGAAIEQGGLNSQAAASRALREQCATDEACFKAGQKAVIALGTPGDEFGQAARFLKNSVVAGDLRLTSDGQLVLAKPDFFSLSNIGTTFYKNQYLRNLETVNKGLMNEPDVNARKMIAMAIYGTDLQDVGLTPITEPGGIKGLTSGLAEGVGKATAAISKANQKYMRAPDVIHRMQEARKAQRESEQDEKYFANSDDPFGAYSSPDYDYLFESSADEITGEGGPQTLSASYTTTNHMSFPSMEVSREEMTQALKDYREAEEAIPYLQQRQAGFVDTLGEFHEENRQDEIDRYEEQKRRSREILDRGVRSLRKPEVGYYKGNLDLDSRPLYFNKDGSVSSEQSIIVEHDGEYYIIPTIRTENGVRIDMTDEEADQYFLETNGNLGYYDNLEEAKAASERIHNRFTLEGDIPAEEYAQRAQAYLPVAAAKYDISPALLDALFTQESRRGTLNESKTGVQGAMQVTRKTFNEIAPKIGLKPEDFNKPEAQMEAGAYYFKEKLDEFEGDVEKAAGAYNGGASVVKACIRDSKKYGGDWKQYLEKNALGKTPKEKREKAKEMRIHMQQVMKYAEAYSRKYYA